MKFLLSLVLMFLAGYVQASPYFRPIDFSHPQMGAGFLISPKTPSATQGILDIALITHSLADGSIIPERYQKYIPPVAWAPLQLGVGGSFKSEATVALGTSANLSPAIAAALLRNVDGKADGWASAIKTALTGEGPGQLRLGGALAGRVVKDGTFQSAKEAFPGCGLFEIVGNAARISVGYAWKF